MPEVYALDAAPSKRRIDPDSGYMYIADNKLSKAGVNPYLGEEIIRFMDTPPEWIETSKVYNIYRPPEELERSAASARGVPFIDEHPDEKKENKVGPFSAETIKEFKDRIIGATGTDIRYEDPYLVGTLVIHDKEAQDKLDSEKDGLSNGYKYSLIPETGIAYGVPYDFRMKDIAINHVALVERGRAGMEIRVNDSINERIEMAQNTSATDTAIVNRPPPPPVSAVRDEEDKLLEKEVVLRRDDIRDEDPRVEAGAVRPGAPVVNDESLEEMADWSIDEMRRRRDELDRRIGELERAENRAEDTEAMVGVRQETRAMDQAIMIRDLEKRVERQVAERFQARDQALEDVRPLVGIVRAKAHDTAESIYRYALSQKGISGVDTADISGLKMAVQALSVAKQPVELNTTAKAYDSATNNKAAEEIADLLSSIRIKGK